MSIVPVTATGVSSRIVASRVFGTTLTHVVVGRDHGLDVGQRHVALELDRQGLAVAAHRADAHAEADRPGSAPRRRRCRGRGSCWSRRRPSTPRGWCRRRRSLSIHGIRLPPSGTPKLRGLGGRHRALPLDDAAGRSRGSPTSDRRAASCTAALQRAVLRQQLAHVLRAAARCGLVGHGGHPLDEVGLEQRADAHQHAAHGAVAADEVAHAALQRVA